MACISVPKPELSGCDSLVTHTCDTQPLHGPRARTAAAAAARHSTLPASDVRSGTSGLQRVAQHTGNAPSRLSCQSPSPPLVSVDSLPAPHYCCPVPDEPRRGTAAGSPLPVDCGPPYAKPPPQQDVRALSPRVLRCLLNSCQASTANMQTWLDLLPVSCHRAACQGTAPLPQHCSSARLRHDHSGLQSALQAAEAHAATQHGRTARPAKCSARC